MAFQIDITWPETGQTVANRFTVSGTYWDDGAAPPKTAAGDVKIVCKLLSGATPVASNSKTFTPTPSNSDWEIALPTGAGTIGDGTYTLTADLFVPDSAAAPVASDTEENIIVSASSAVQHAPVVFTFSED